MPNIFDKWRDFIYVLLDLPTFPLFLFYLILVTIIWPRIHEFIPKLNLKLVIQSLNSFFLHACVVIKLFFQLMKIHNLLCILLSCFSFCGLSWFLSKKTASMFSRTSDPSLSSFLQLYWWTKIIELLDTFYMMLRKKRRQVKA